jgi:hypothetical protein
MSSLIDTFAAPGSAYRGKPFWAWNGPLEAAELRRQIRCMHRMGLGGFFMHSRVGLATPYLSAEWMDLVKACIDEARELGMEAWLYDEDRWPSGAAGGLVTKPNEAYRMRFLVCEEAAARAYRPAKEHLAAFAVKKQGASLTGYRRLRGRARPQRGERVLVFTVEPMPPSEWYNLGTYLDTMNHEAVRAFIQTTHQAYEKDPAIRREMGSTVPGIFTDEPHHGPVLQGPHGIPGKTFVPWTGRLPAVFRERYGYDLRNHLPELFFDLADHPVRPARWHYHDCKTFLFVDAFARQIGEWCDRTGMQHTGHVLSEPTCSRQANVVGSTLRFYEYMQAPGIDILTDQVEELDTAKQCSSVAHQFGRRWVLSELYGCTGWHWPFEGHKAVGDWQAALGVNLRCQHLSWYTMLGQAKRDYPASIHYQSPWWEAYPVVEDYFARVNAFITEGEPVQDLLVIHPVESTWARYVQDNGEELQALDERLIKLRNALLQNHVDFDYGDEEMLARHGKVRRARDGRPARLALNRAAYTTVLVPPLVTVRASTLALLERFARAGGTVVFAGEAPDYVDALPSDAAHELAARDEVSVCGTGARSVVRAVSGARRVSIRDGAGREIKSVLYQLRDHGHSRGIFLCNTDRKRPCETVEIVLPGAFAEEWDPATGERYRARTRREGGELVVETSLPPTGSRLFLIRDRAIKGLPRRPRLESRSRQPLTRQRWDIRRNEPNVLVLDRPAWRFDRKSWRQPEEILRIDHACREELGLRPRGGRMVQPWAREEKGKGPAAPLALRYAIHCEALPEGPVALGLEQPGRFTVTLNGEPVSTDAESGWWVDRSLRTLPLDPALFREGINELLLETEFCEGHDLEAAFLLGEFGVRVRGAEAALVAPPQELRIGDWTRQGLPFYSGNVIYTCTIRPRLQRGERLVVEVPDFSGACVRVAVDGETVGTIAWEPQELDITEAVTSGTPALLALEVLGNRRNSHGPLHNVETTSRWTGAGQFTTAGEGWQDEYNLLTMGLLKAPVLSRRRPAR